MIQQLVYLSKAREPTSQLDCKNIIKASEVNNKEVGVTGILIFCHGHFLQLLEGDSDKVDFLFDVIKKDTRHENVSVLYKKQDIKRLTEGWSMALVNVNSLTTLSLHDSTLPVSELRKLILEPRIRDSEKIVWTLIKSFIEFKKNHDDR